MRAKVNMLFSAVTPHMVCKDLGLAIASGKNSIPVIVDPLFGNATISVLNKEFVAGSYNPDFQFGNVVDFTVYVKQITYIDALDYLIEKFEDSLEDALLASIKWLRLDIADYLQELFSINRKLTKLIATQHKVTNAKSYLEDKNLLWASTPQFVIPCTGSDILNIFDSLTSNEFKNNNLPVKSDGTYILYPYYVNYHTLSALVAEDISTGNLFLLYESRFTHGILGYHTIPPENFTAVLCEDIAEASEVRMNMLNFGKVNCGVIVVRANGSDPKRSNEGFIVPGKVPRVLVGTPKVKYLSKIIKYFDYADDIRYSDDVYKFRYSNCKCCRHAIVEGFFKLFKNTPTDEDVINKYIEYATKDPIIKSEIEQHLKYTGNTKLLTWGDDTVFGNSKTMSVFGGELNYTKDGYILSKNDSTRSNRNEACSTPITNFTVVLREALLFHNSSDVFYTGKLHIAGKSHKVTLPKSAIQKPYNLLKYLTKVVSTSEDSSVKLPVIYDNSYNKYITAALLQESNLTSSQFGISELGWVKSRSEFIGPGWSVDCDSAVVNAKPLHPECPLFDSFNHTNVNPETPIAKGNDSKTVLAIVTAALCRTYLDWSVPVVKVLDNPLNRQFLLESLTIFGQTQLHYINTNERRHSNNIPGLSGYPLICYSNNSPQDFSDNILFYLSPNVGISFYQGEDPALLGSYLKFLVPKLINKMLKHDCSFFEKVSDTVPGLVEEGSQVLRKLLDYPEFTCVDLVEVDIDQAKPKKAQ